VGRWKEKKTCMTWKKEERKLIRKKLKAVLKISINREMEKV